MEINLCLYSFGLAKGFDTVYHTLLCNILFDFGSNGISLLWFQIYLQNRTQITNANGTLSEYKVISCGVP